MSNVAYIIWRALQIHVEQWKARPIYLQLLALCKTLMKAIIHAAMRWNYYANYGCVYDWNICSIWRHWWFSFKILTHVAMRNYWLLEFRKKMIKLEYQVLNIVLLPIHLNNGSDFTEHECPAGPWVLSKIITVL